VSLGVIPFCKLIETIEKRPLLSPANGETQGSRPGIFDLALNPAKDGEQFFKDPIRAHCIWFQSPVLLQMVIGLCFHF
jgi:hypothetical protein